MAAWVSWWLLGSVRVSITSTLVSLIDYRWRHPGQRKDPGLSVLELAGVAESVFECGHLQLAWQKALAPVVQVEAEVGLRFL